MGRKASILNRFYSMKTSKDLFATSSCSRSREIFV